MYFISVFILSLKHFYKQEFKQVCYLPLIAGWQHHLPALPGQRRLHGLGPGGAGDTLQVVGITIMMMINDAPSYGMELRDTGDHGFLMPPDQIVGTGEEVWAFHAAVAREIITEFAV